MTPAEVLERSADLIDQVGWAQGSFEVFDPLHLRPRVCAIGAMRTVIGVRGDIMSAHQSPPEFFGAVTALRQAIGTHLVAAWNDAPTTTKRTVTSTMRSAAAKLRAQESAQLLREAKAEK